jgi:hypothetical protein
MASSIFGQQGGNTIMQTIGQLKQAAGGDFQAACSFLDNAGITRTLPNGQQVTASQFAQMMRGKTPEQAFSQFGFDANEYRGRF